MQDNNINSPDLKQIKESLASLDEKWKQIRGDMNTDNKNDDVKNMMSMMDIMGQRLGYLRDYVYAVEDSMWNMMENHKKGHLPPIHSAGKMNKALKALGCDDDYNVQKPIIYARASHKGTQFEATLNFKK